MKEYSQGQQFCHFRICQLLNEANPYRKESAPLGEFFFDE